ncbi:MAG: DUF3237 domain-containing protein [Prevotella sp.]|nr:DUF3237 domain-containing protein [Prevotella sp.]
MMTLLALTVGAQTYPPSGNPQLEFVMQLRVSIGNSFSIPTPKGTRTVIPITGGTFQGPNIQGTILNGGADYQLSSADGNRTELEAIYCIKTNDGAYIHVRNKGLVVNNPYFFKASPQFEAPTNGNYAWLNTGIFICEPQWDGPNGTITLNVWKVK